MYSMEGMAAPSRAMPIAQAELEAVELAARAPGQVVSIYRVIRQIRAEVNIVEVVPEVAS